jgi:hypothetical protein
MNIRGRAFAAACIVASLMVSGCAIGNKHRYDDVVAPLRVEGSNHVGVGVSDRRPYVISGSKSPTFVGLQRGGYGNPFNVSTSSGASLADDMASALVRSLNAKGFQAVAVVITVADDPSRVVSRLTEGHPDRALLLVLREWKADTYQNTALLYDVSLQVLDGEGRLLAEKKLVGKDNLGGSFWNPPAHAKEAVPQAFVRKLTELLDDPQVAAALAAKS